MLTHHGGRRAAALAVVGACALLSPAAASATTKTVEVGTFGGKAQKAFQKAGGDANAFLRSTITVHTGDTVKWSINGFHNVMFVPKGTTPPALFGADPANPVTGVNDAAGNPFWFNGQPRITLNPAVGAPSGGKVFSSSKIMNSGLPSEEGPPKPYKLKFTKAGTFHYLCSVHPGMVGTVKVVKKSTRIPTPAADKKAASKEQSAILAEVKKLSKGPSGLSNTIQAGNDSGAATVYGFFPRNPTFKAGTTVTITMPPSTRETHTLTIGPTNGKSLYLDALANGFISPDGSGAIVLDPRAVYPSENPASGVPAFDGTNHGNGFYNSGALDGLSASPLPKSTQVTFTTPGTYKYICVIHPFMTGQVTITP